MSSISDILSKHGLTVQAVTTGRGIDPIVRDVYKALNEGAKYAYIFIAETSDEILALFASCDEVTNGEAFVVQADSGFDVATLRRKINYRSTSYVDKAGKPRAKVTLGRASLSHNIVSDEGAAVGFRVNASQ